MAAMQRAFGQASTTTSYPIGLRSTLAWLDDVARLTGTENRVRASPEVARLEERIDATRTRFSGRTAYVWHPGEKGLALARFADEVGLAPSIIAMTYWMQEQTKRTITAMIAGGQDYPVIIKGWLDLWQKHVGTAHTERPLLFMPKHFWSAELPTVTIDLFHDSAIGLTGAGKLLDAVEDAIATAGRKNYSLFDRFVERRYRKTQWHA